MKQREVYGTADDGTGDDATADDEENVGGDPVSTRSDKRHRAMKVVVMGFGSLGAIYGDIGTSPLYVLNTIFTEPTVSKKDVIGATSCIFWLFTLVVIVKYCLIVLTLGPNNGEGGQIAIYCKLSRVLKTGPLGVTLPGEKEHDDLQLLTRSETRDSAISARSFLRDSPSLLSNEKFKKVFSVVSMIACFFGCALVMADGLLTPTTSVLSAVDGIAVAVPSFSNKVMPVAVCILLILFFIQPMGSQYISIAFSPIVTAWFLTILVIGIINIVPHPEVFKALSPKEAIDFLRSQGDVDALGAVMLSITGCEAMFADVGHFSPLSVQLTLGCFVYPCLMITYLGQASYLIDHPEGITNIFYNSVPGGTSGGFYWYVFVMSTLATVIASQALILGCFSILSQMIRIDCFPRLKITHKSAKHHGQIFLPTVNFILMVAVICTCVGFKDSANVTSAYGLGVSMDLFITTTFITATITIVYKVHWLVALLYFLPFGTLEMCLVVANMKKVPHGAWFTLMIAVTMFTFFSLWRWGMASKVKHEYKDKVRLKDVLVTAPNSGEPFYLGSKNAPEPSTLPEGLKVKLSEGVYMDVMRHKDIMFMHTNVSLLLNSPNTVPGLFRDMAMDFPSLPSIFVFLAIKVASIPYVDEEERVLVSPMKDVEGFYRCVIRYGFMDKVKITERTVALILEEIREYNPAYFEEVSKLSPRTPLNVFNREHINGIKSYRDFDVKGNAISKSLFGFVGETIRSFIIERFFSPLYNLQAMPSSVISTDCSDRVIYVGKDIEI